MTTWDEFLDAIEAEAEADAVAEKHFRRRAPRSACRRHPGEPMFAYFRREADLREAERHLDEAKRDAVAWKRRQHLAWRPALAPDRGQTLPDDFRAERDESDEPDDDAARPVLFRRRRPRGPRERLPRTRLGRPVEAGTNGEADANGDTERADLNAALERSWAQFQAGELRDADDVLEELSPGLRFHVFRLGRGHSGALRRLPKVTRRTWIVRSTRFEIDENDGAVWARSAREAIVRVVAKLRGLARFGAYPEFNGSCAGDEWVDR